MRYEPPSRQADAFTTDLAEAKQLFAYWRDPDLPVGWTFSHASSGGISDPEYGYCAGYLNESGYAGANVCVSYLTRRPEYLQGQGDWILETRLIEGYPALLMHHAGSWPTTVNIFDPATGIEYHLRGKDTSLKSSANIDAAIEIARSLLPATGAP